MSGIAVSTESLAASIERHRMEVSRFLYGRVGCADTAADLYQSIAENLLRRNPEPPIRNIRAFLFEAARNAASNQHRSERTRTEFAILARPLLDESCDQTPDNLIEADEALTRVNQALQDLPVLTRVSASSASIKLSGV